VALHVNCVLLQPHSSAAAAAAAATAAGVLLSCSFVPRHNSTTPAELDAMVAVTGFSSMDALIDATVPKSIRRSDGMDMGQYTSGMTESAFLEYFK
jgi:glycine dehydrogenase